MHTPGPWTIEVDHSCDAPEFIRAQLDGEMFDIATLSNETGSVVSNARLIAAAPDLLAALQHMVDMYQRHFDVMPVAWQTADDIARAAIARATGGQ